MKKILLPSLVILAILLILDYILYQVTFLSGEKEWVYMVDFLLKSILIFLLIINFLYNKAFTLKSRKIAVILFLAIPLIISMLISDRLVAINKFYYYSKTLSRITTGGIWQFNDSLSYIGIPNSTGTYNYYIGDSIEGSVPLIFDSLGFRTVPDSLRIRTGETDLYLGCSFTFGDYVEAQKTYSFLTSALMEHNCINGAILGYGAGQMVQIAEKLIPKRPFKHVFIQMSSWIVPRAMELNGPTRFGYRPFPYYSGSGDSFSLNLPAYKTKMYSFRNWRKTERTYLEKVKFSFSDGYNIEVHDYLAYRFAQVKMSLGILPEPTRDKTALEKYFYDHMIDLCVQNSVTPVILKLRYPDNECKDLVTHLRTRVKIIDLDSALQAVIDQTGYTYKQLFRIRHYHGNDSIIFDQHPNKFAHAIFSNTIFNELKDK
jgi:hypothetical protein